MVLTSLPTVLLQSVMRCCDVRDLLALSRSCRAALQASSAPFPWSLLSAPLCTLQPDFVGSLSRSLLRFTAAVDLHWLAPDEGPWLAAADIDAIQSLARLRRLVAWLSDDDDIVPWESLLLHPCFAELESLDVLSPTDPDAHDWGDALVSLRRVHTLTVRGRSPSGVFNALPRMVSLTSLSVNMSFVVDSKLGHIGECAGLVSLTLSQPYLPDHLPLMLTARQVALREVTLIEPAFNDVSADGLQWCDALNRLPALCRISVIGCQSDSGREATLLVALTHWLLPGGPLRVLTLNTHPRVQPPLSLIPGLMSALPLLERFEWELFEVVRQNPSQVAARVRGTTLDVASENQMKRWQSDARSMGARLQRMDPRITMLEPQQTLTRQEQESRLRRKYSAQA